MERRKFTREFKLEAVRLVRERGVTVAQAARDLGVHGTMLHRWVQECVVDSQQTFPGQGQMKPDQVEIERLRREVTKLKGKRDILKKAATLLREGVAVKCIGAGSRIRLSVSGVLRYRAAGEAGPCQSQPATTRSPFPATVCSSTLQDRSTVLSVHRDQ